MTNDDESFLSAYMDGQLDTDEQQWVESALVSNPQLAEKLRSLTSLRDLVAGLSRDAPINVAPQVMARIKSASGPRTAVSGFQSWRLRSRRLFSPNGILAAAAGLLAAATLVLSRTTPIEQAGPASLPLASSDIHRGGSATPDSPAPIKVATSDDQARSSSSQTESIRSGVTGTGETGDGGLDAHPAENTELTASHDLEAVRQYIDHPNLRRLFYVGNPRGGQSAQTVASIVERTARHGFYKITISQGIVIDPRHPDRATVFALVVNTNDLNSLENQLKVALPGLFEEKPVEPAIVTQLADAGQVERLASVPMAEVLIAHDHLALRTKVAPGTESAGQSGRPIQNRATGDLDPPTVEQERSAPLPETAGGGGADSAGTPAPSQTVAPHVRASRPALASRPVRDATRDAGIAHRESGAAAAQADLAKSSEARKIPSIPPVADDENVVLVWVYESGPS